MAETNPRTKIPDSEIRIENIIQGSPSFVPYKIKVKTPKGREKGVKEVKMNNMGSDLGMARSKKTDNSTENHTSGEGIASRKSCPAQTSSDIIWGKGPLKTVGY